MNIGEKIRKSIQQNRDDYERSFSEKEKQAHSDLHDFFLYSSIKLKDLLKDFSILTHPVSPIFSFDPQSQNRRYFSGDFCRLPSIIANFPRGSEYVLNKSQLDVLLSRKKLNTFLERKLLTKGFRNPCMIDFEILEFPPRTEIIHPYSDYLFDCSDISDGEIADEFRTHEENLFRYVEKLHLQFAVALRKNSLIYFPVYVGFGTNSVFDLSLTSFNTNSDLRFYKQFLNDEFGFIEKYRIVQEKITSDFNDFSTSQYVDDLLQGKSLSQREVVILRSNQDLIELVDKLLPEYEAFAEELYDPDNFVKYFGLDEVREKALRFQGNDPCLIDENNVKHDYFYKEPLTFERLKWGSLLLVYFLSSKKMSELIYSGYYKNFNDLACFNLQS